MIFRYLRHFSPLVSFMTVVLFILGLAQPAMASQATQNMTLQSVRVQIWPEYDKPSALVIYNVTLPATVTLPASLTLRIPAKAGKPYAVAWQSADKALYDIKYETSAAGDWIQVKFSTPAQDFRVEYYDPSLAKAGTQRSFTFRWPGDYTVENLTLEIQQPVNASGMSFIPSAGSGQVNNSDGLTYYNLLAGKVNAGTTFDLSMTYTKPDDSLTIPSQYQAASPNQPVSSATGRITADQMLPWIIAGVGLLLIVVGMIWYYRSGRAGYSRQERGRARHAKGAAVSADAPGEGEDSETVFCTQCGKRAAPGDAFCRACGTQLIRR